MADIIVCCFFMLFVVLALHYHRNLVFILLRFAFRLEGRCIWQKILFFKYEVFLFRFLCCRYLIYHLWFVL